MRAIINNTLCKRQMLFKERFSNSLDSHFMPCLYWLCFFFIFFKKERNYIIDRGQVMSQSLFARHSSLKAKHTNKLKKKYVYCLANVMIIDKYRHADSLKPTTRLCDTIHTISRCSNYRALSLSMPVSL